jgi:hypothetical protein
MGSFDSSDSCFVVDFCFFGDISSFIVEVSCFIVEVSSFIVLVSSFIADDI